MIDCVTQWRDVIEMLTLALVVGDDPDAQARLDAAVARIRVEHGFRHARMGGELINPWSLARDINQKGDAGSAADDLLARNQAMLANRVHDRADASILREIEGLRLLVARDDLVAVAGDEDNVPLETWYEVLEPFSDSWHAQVNASVTYRDSVLDLVEQTRQNLAEVDPGTANRYHDEAMMRGFGSEMRTRWSERAIRASLALDDLDDETRLVIESLQDDTASQLRTIRSRAIEKRLKRDPELASKPILSLWSLDDSREKPWTAEDWTGHETDSHLHLNQQVASSLHALLTPEQFDTLPKRARDKDDKGRNKDSGKGKGA